MIDSNAILLMLNSLESSDRTFKSTIDKFIRLGIEIANETEEFQEELGLYDDKIYHFYINDLDYNIWLKKIGRSVFYSNSYYEENPEGLNVIHFFFTKTTMKKVITRKMNAGDAFMRGLIKIQGEASDAMQAKNLLSLFFTYMDYIAYNSE
ncbi:MAG: SCP2 sterol-binding domain-containing protein [Candidatus Hermodarchaeota archaeon]